MHDYDRLDERVQGEFRIVIDKTWEDLNPRDQFEESDVEEILRKIDNCTYDWFMLRVRVMVDGIEMGSAYLGGCLYEDAREVLTDGTADDLVAEAMADAKDYVYKLMKKLQAINEEIEREGVAV